MAWGDDLAARGVLKDKPLIDAFNDIDRVDFLPSEFGGYAYEERPLPIGYGQTNSSPFVVAQMLQWLQPKEGHKVLDIGAGSGWTTALLAYVVGQKGHVTAVERIPELVDMARRNAAKYQSSNIEIHQAENRVIGWPQAGTFDRILVSATAHRNTVDEIIKQLGQKGRLVIPLVADHNGSGFYDHSIHVFIKDGKSISEEKHSGYVFVPLIAKSVKNPQIYGT